VEATLFLSKVVGLTLIVIGAVIMLRRRELVPVFATYTEQRLLRFIMSMIELVAGLALVMHNAWSPPAAAILTLLGWMAVVEGAFYMLAPDDVVARFMAAFNTERWYIVGGALAVLVGLYLLGFGFGWW
jgi:hypothetical protein